MYQKFVTQGIVLSKGASGEANVFVTLLSKEHGLVRAAARSARRERSKLRYGLEPLTVARFSLVRGRGEWRLVGVEEVERALLRAKAPRRQALARIGRLILRLVAGEESHPALYSDVEEGFFSLAATENDRDAASIECITVLRVLHRLGYLSHSDEVAQFLRGSADFLQLASQAAAHRSRLVRLINDSLSASGL